jgi:phage terminase Nu1 subunit (DNA packaging protein)
LDVRRTHRTRNKNQEIDMVKKTIASVGLAAAATAGALLLTGSPASAQTTPASARANVAYVQTSAVSTERHPGDDWGYRWGHHRSYYRNYRHQWNRHFNFDLNRRDH